ncbi:LL-diaminopimelate aminotransferase, chloroplastic [Tanacetum coccineum]
MELLQDDDESRMEIAHMLKYPDVKVIRVGIGDIVEPIRKVIASAMAKFIDGQNDLMKLQLALKKLVSEKGALEILDVTKLSFTDALMFLIIPLAGGVTLLCAVVLHIVEDLVKRCDLRSTLRLWIQPDQATVVTLLCIGSGKITSYQCCDMGSDGYAYPVYDMFGIVDPNMQNEV